MSRWKVSSNTVHNVGYHITWCPKDRPKILVGDVESRIRDLLYEISAEIGVSIEKTEVMPEDLHLFVTAHPGHAPHYMLQHLKGRTSRTLRSEFPGLSSKLPSLWTRSYYLETIKKYIENQKKA